jgi:hypothetical protein
MSIEEKLSVLESRIRRQRIGMAGMCLGLFVVLFLGMAQPPPKVLVLEGLTIMKDGKPRVVMGTNEKDGGVGIALLDVHGKPTLAIGNNEKGESGIVCMDENEFPRISIGTGPRGAAISLIGAALIELPDTKDLPKK